MPFYSDHTAALRAELGEALPRDLLRQFHLKSAWRHMLVGARQFAILGVATWGLVEFEHPAIWIPLAFAQGFTVFNFTGPAGQGMDRGQSRAALELGFGIINR